MRGSNFGFFLSLCYLLESLRRDGCMPLVGIGLLKMDGWTVKMSSHTDHSPGYFQLLPPHNFAVKCYVFQGLGSTALLLAVSNER
jgi:hypothetical protein